MKLILALCALLLFIFASSAQAATWYVRNNGGSTSRCTGHTNAPDPGSGTAQPCAYSNPADAIAAASCGDTIKALAGDRFGPSSYTLPNKSCTTTGITITSTVALPNRRVGDNTNTDAQADEALMPTFTTNGSVGYGAAFVYGTNASDWTLDGLIITDEATPEATIINFLIDGLTNTGLSDITVQRCIFKQKETGANYHRSVMRAVWFEGSNFTFERNYVHLIGWYYDATGNTPFYPMDTTAFLTVAGPGPITIDDNYISVWWNGFFLGGADTAAQNTANVTSGTNTSGTFSNTTGITAGLLLRLEMHGTGTLDGSNFLCANPNPNEYHCTRYTETSGFTVSAAEQSNNGYSGRPIIFTGGGHTYRGLVWKSLGSGVSEITQNGVNDAGSYSATLMETAMASSVVGSTVNYAAWGIDGISPAQTPTTASWNYGDQGLISDVTVHRNTFAPDTPFAIANFGHRGSVPKGAFEIKNVNRLDFNGNYLTAFPGNLGMTAANQNGTAPWTTVTNVHIHNNYVHPTGGDASNGGLGYDGRGIIISNDAYLQTDRQGQNFVIENNLITNTAMFGIFKGYNGWTFQHNTVLADGSTLNGYCSFIAVVDEAMQNVVMRDNIIGHRCYGIQVFAGGGTLAEGMPSAVFGNNVIVDFLGMGVAPGTYGAIGVPTSFASVGFVNAAGLNYRLASSSAFKNAGSDGNDPGVNYTTLAAALGFDPSTSVSVCRWSTTPPCADQ